MMVELSLHEVQWSREHGQPVVMLRAAGHSTGTLAIVLSTSDAQLLAVKPPTACFDRLRLFSLLETVVGALGAVLTEVRLRLDARMVLTGELCYTVAGRTVLLPANFTDAVVLARRAGAPLLIAEDDLRWILAMQPQPTSVAGGLVEIPGAALARAITDFIESLKIDDLSGPSRRAS